MDREAEGQFAQFVAACAPRLLRTAYLLTSDRGHAEDLVQITLERVALRWHRIDGNPEPYARRVLVNAATDWRRRRRARVTEVPEVEMVDPSGNATDQVNLQQSLAVALRRLPMRQRCVLVLRYFNDMTEDEVADVMNVSVGTVKSTASRALARLRGLVPATGEEMLR
jgi:RNA polymerase sigma-70 factor (sigma-E family)